MFFKYTTCLSRCWHGYIHQVFNYHFAEWPQTIEAPFQLLVTRADNVCKVCGMFDRQFYTQHLVNCWCVSGIHSNSAFNGNAVKITVHDGNLLIYRAGEASKVVHDRECEVSLEQTEPCSGAKVWCHSGDCGTWSHSFLNTPTLTESTATHAWSQRQGKRGYY